MLSKFLLLSPIHQNTWYSISKLLLLSPIHQNIPSKLSLLSPIHQNTLDILRKLSFLSPIHQNTPDILSKLLLLSPIHKITLDILSKLCRPWWLSWMRRPTGDQEVAGSTPAEVGNILSWWLIVKYFLRSFSPFRWFKKGSCQFRAKECAQYW